MQPRITTRALALAGVLALGSVSASAQMTESQVRDSLWRRLPRIGSATLQRVIAQYLGLRTVAGKPLVRPQRTPSSFPGRPSTSTTPIAPQIAPTDDFDHIVSGDPVSIDGLQTTSSVAVNPLDPNIVVVLGENTNSFTGDSQDCSMYISLDGGVGYTYARDLPLGGVAAPRVCGDPVVRFSPDGTTLYVAYMEAQELPPQPDTVVWLKSYNGFDPSSPEIATQSFSAVAPDLQELPWLAVHTFDNTSLGAGYVYLTYTFHTATTDNVYFGRFSNSAASVDIAPAVLASADTSGTLTPVRVLQGARPAAGPQSQVLVCWFDAGADGYSTAVQVQPPTPPTPVAPLNKFNIACRTSNDRGMTFAGSVDPPESVTPADPTRWLYAAKGVAYELANYMGPMPTVASGFFAIHTAQNPSLTIDHKGNAHIVFSYNPAPTNRFKTEQGNVAYVRSVLRTTTPTTASPFLYPTWIRTNPAIGYGAQVFPTVVAQQWFDFPRIYIGWVDTSVTATFGAANANVVYDVRYRRSNNGGVTFGPTVVMSDHWSISDFSTIGDYIDSTANNGMFHLSWSDNRFGEDALDPHQHLYSDRN